ncbi:MAG TPA: protein translocase subunit SecD [Candidatus Paceibacterota bacterium]
MLITRIVAAVILLVGFSIGWWVYSSEVGGTRQFRLGLDLSGGTQLTYRADLSSIQESEVADSMAALRDTIERRVNLFGVAEPIVQTEKSGVFAETREERLIVELPGVTETEEAIRLLGETPVLEFRMMKENAERGVEITPETIPLLFESAAITGRHLKSSQLQFDQGTAAIGEPVVVLNFNGEGKRVFAELTRENVGRIFGIFLDGVPISTPVIREAIPDGTAVISGSFTPESARELARNLNFGALPVPIQLIGTQTVSGTLGAEAVSRGLEAGSIGIIAVAIFMVVWYRLPGVLATFALLLYVIAILALFKLIPVTLTAAGIAAFILSIGMAVDANVLIFERMKEELESGKEATDAIHNGFARAWASIRDSNISSIITAVILFWFGTSLVKGFALVFGLGVIVSMLTAISVSRTLLFALGIGGGNRVARFLLGCGFRI